MKKIRRPYVVDGQQIWITGTNEQEIAENYAEAFLSAKGFSPTQDTMRHDLCELIDKWFECKKDKKEITLQTAKNYDTHVRSGVISIDKAIAFIGNAPILKGPKSVAGIRDLPIFEQLYNVLWPIKKPTGVIVSIDGEKNYSDTAYGRAWERISRQIDLKDFTAHSFRHSVASIYAASSEVTPKTLQTLLGHTDIATTMNVYAKTETHTLMKAGKIFT